MEKEKAIWEAALRKLSLRPHSRHELKAKLLQDFDDETAVEKTLGEMERVQLLNDRRFTEEFVHHLIQKPVGRVKIGVETHRRGLSRELVEQCLQNENWSEEESARRALEEGDSRWSRLEGRALRQKMVSHLKNRGFSDAAIYRVVRDDL